VAGEAHVAAKVGIAFPAVATFAAGDGRIDRHSLSLSVTAVNDAGELVTQHQRSIQAGIANAGRLIPVQIGAAKPDGRYAQHNLVLSGDRIAFIVQAQLTNSV
jgi:hypothetical protein